MLAKLGSDQFGIWALVSVIFGIFSAFDLGMGATFVKYFSEYYIKKDKEEFNRTFIAGILFIAVIMSSLVLITFLGIDQILLFFKIPIEMHETAAFVFLGTSIIFAFYKTFSIFLSILNGIQRMDITNSILIVASIIHAIGTIIVLELGLGLRGLLLNQGSKFLIIILGSIPFAIKLAGPIQLKFSLLKFKHIKKLLDYGLKLQINSIANLINMQTDKTLIGYFVNLSGVSIYEIGQKISLFYRMIVTLLLSALVPAISELDASGGKNKIICLYERGNKYLFTMTFPISVFIFFTSDMLIRIWIGEGYPNASRVTQLLIIGVTINMLTGIGTSIVRGIGKPVIETRYAVICLLLNIIFGLLLATYYGFWGIIVATPLSVIIGSIFFIIQFHRMYSIPILSFYHKLFMKPFLISIIIGIIFYLINGFLITEFSINTRFVFIALLLIDGLIFFSLLIFILKKIRYWNLEDKALFINSTEKYPKIKRILSSCI